MCFELWKDILESGRIQIVEDSSKMEVQKKSKRNSSNVFKLRKKWILQNLHDKNHIFHIEQIHLLEPFKGKKSKSKSKSKKRASSLVFQSQNLLKQLNKVKDDLDAFSA